MILTDGEPRLGSGPALCPGLNGQAEEVLATRTSQSPSFLSRSSSIIVPTAGVGPWGILPFCSYLHENSPIPVLTCPKCWTLNGTDGSCGLGCMWLLYLFRTHRLLHVSVSSVDGISAAGSFSGHSVCEFVKRTRAGTSQPTGR